MKVLCWNAQWHRASSPQGAVLRDRLLAAKAEIVCCPEAHKDFLPDEWHGIFSRPDTGYAIKPGRRKVTLWSQQPWDAIDDLGSADLPPGRFVRATTNTSLGPVHVIGVCVPWPDAHVSDGRQDRQRWEDHILYLRALQPILKAVEQDTPTVLIGDFNQSMPRRRAPQRAYEQLRAMLGDFKVWTKGEIAGLDTLPLCHIAGSRLAATKVTGFSRWHDGRRLSDHDGLDVALALR
ncbi:MAG: endonuclease/exonuclease/phosphatase family protein [Mesorhizobium sp.]|nr:MAG: endonuclease/exonuclease/phosphatase family protein [Mesorhizobium sp.]